MICKNVNGQQATDDRPRSTNTKSTNFLPIGKTITSEPYTAPLLFQERPGEVINIFAFIHLKTVTRPPVILIPSSRYNNRTDRAAGRIAIIVAKHIILAYAYS
jgi:hypothetical protein